MELIRGQQDEQYDSLRYLNYAGMATIMVLASLGLLSLLSMLQNLSRSADEAPVPLDAGLPPEPVAVRPAALRRR